LKMVMLGVRSPQSITCGVGASVSRIELYNSDRFVSFVYVFYVILLLYSLMSTICMKLDPGIHIGMHLVCFSKTRCDKGEGVEERGREAALVTPLVRQDRRTFASAGRCTRRRERGRSRPRRRGSRGRARTEHRNERLPGTAFFVKPGTTTSLCAVSFPQYHDCECAVEPLGEVPPSSPHERPPNRPLLF
jgi:hypothetical protein